MKIGTSSQVVQPYPILEAVDLLARWGYEAVEIWTEHVWRDQPGLTALRRRALDAGMTTSLHAPVRDTNPTSSNPGIQKESLRQCIECLEMAAELEAQTIAIHPGRLSSERDQTGDFWPRQLEMFAVIARSAETLGLKVGIENMERRSREFVVTPGDVLKIISAVGSPALGFTLDLAHAFTVPGIDLVDFVRQASPVMNLHISDCSGSRIHLPLGEGDLDLSPALDELALRYDGAAVIEGYWPGRELSVIESNIQVARTLIRSPPRTPLPKHVPENEEE